MKEISDGLASHPLTIHFREEHGGRQQEVLLRILSRHISPLERQVVESLNIIKASKISEECLNLKSGWGGVKTARPPSPQTQRNRRRCQSCPRTNLRKSRTTKKTRRQENLVSRPRRTETRQENQRQKSNTRGL